MKQQGLTPTYEYDVIETEHYPASIQPPDEDLATILTNAGAEGFAIVAAIGARGSERLILMRQVGVRAVPLELPELEERRVIGAELRPAVTSGRGIQR